MKTRTADFDVAWGNRRSRKAAYKITYKRNLWDGVSAYALESSSHTIISREIGKIAGISWKLDVPIANRILPSNVTLYLKDNGYKWLPSNSAGIWNDGASYEPVGSEFTVWYGYYLADGSIEYVAIFTGRLVDDPRFDSTTGLAQLALVGKAESKLEAKSAQHVGTTLTAQSLGTGDASTKNFTGQKSIWTITNVKVAGVLKTQGDAADYTLDKLNDADNGAIVQFTAAPAGAAALLYDYEQWYRDKSIATLVGLLCDAAGIPSGEREIQEPLFASGVLSSHLWDTQADWQGGGVQTNIDATFSAGNLLKGLRVDTFADGDYTVDPVWTVQSGTWNFHADDPLFGGGKAIFASSGAISTPRAFSGTAFEAKFQFGAGQHGADQIATFTFLSSNADGTGNGYVVEFDNPGTSTPTIATIYRLDAGVRTSLGDVTLNGSDMYLTSIAGPWYLKRDSSGIITLSTTGAALITTAADSTYTTGSYYVLAANASLDMFFWNLFFNDLQAGIWESAEVDLLATPSAWAPLAVSKTVPAGWTVTIKTNVAAISGGPYDGYVAVDGSMTPTSALKRYAKVRVEITAPSGEFDPTVCLIDSIRLYWYATQLNIKSADFTDMSCLDAVAELAGMGGMEYGSKGDGTFFFRNKSVSSSADLTLSHRNAIATIQNYETGYREVYNVGQVRYGQSGQQGYYFAQWKASDAAEAAPTTADRFGERVLALDLQKFIFSNDAQVAIAIARKLYDNNYRPKRRIQVKSRIIPHLDLSDKVSLSFHDSPLIEASIFGDPLNFYPVTGPNAQTLARDLVMKVIGHSMDPMKSESILDLEEVLS